MIDSYGRDIRYLRISVTDRCNLRCVYCMPPEGVPLLPHDRILGYEQIAKVAAAAAELGFMKFRLTGGEPLVRRDLPVLVEMLSALPQKPRITMTTNGTLLAPVARTLKRYGLESVNISLDTLDVGRFREITRGGRLSDVLEGVSAALSARLPVKLNVVMLDARSDRDLTAIRRYAAAIGASVQTIGRYDLSEPKTDGIYDRPPPCEVCNRLRLLADGTLRPCLHQSKRIPVDFNDPCVSVKTAVIAKPRYGTACEEKAVSTLGG